MDKTLFYTLGIALVVSAVVLSLVGLRYEKFPPNRAVLFGVVAYFIALVGATATFAILNANDEQAAREAENAAAANQISTTESTPSATTTTESTSAAPSGG